MSERVAGADTIEGNGVVLRRTGAEHLAVLRDLFDDPGVHEHWGGRPLTDAEIAERYLGRRRPSVECYLVEVAGRVAGFVQLHVSDDGGPGGGMDLVIRPAERARGVGSAVVAALAEYVVGRLGWPRFTVDPDASNGRAVNFWRTAGFRPRRLVDGDPHRGPYWLMEWPFAPAPAPTTDAGATTSREPPAAEVPSPRGA